MANLLGPSCSWPTIWFGQVMVITHAPLVSAIIIPKPPSLASVASPLRSLSLNTCATFIYAGRVFSMSDSLETIMVSIHIPQPLFNLTSTHRASISFLKLIATASSPLPSFRHGLLILQLLQFFHCIQE
jgi:hypothetical protein